MQAMLDRYKKDEIRPATPDSSFSLSSGMAAHELIVPKVQTSPLVFASPHSGRQYPVEFLAKCTLPLLDLRRVEDAYIDLVFDQVAELGAPLLHALVGRACLDLNRDSSELDSTMFLDDLDQLVLSRSPRVSAGLGCIPRVAFKGAAIYSEKLSVQDAYQRLDGIYHPYHESLNAVLNQTEERFGLSILIDCHSMPSTTESGAHLPDIVLGDRFGASCSPAIVRLLESGLKKHGFTVARNAPYAGGHITTTHGQPRKKRHALQIEINRKLYLDEESVAPNDKFGGLKNTLATCFRELAEWSIQFSRLNA